MKNFLVLAMFLSLPLFALNYTPLKALISATHGVTSTWSIVGSAILNPGLNDDGYFDTLVLMGSMAVGGASNVRVRARFSETSDGTLHNYLIQTVGASSIAIENAYYEFNVDADNNFILDIPVMPLKYVTVEAQMGTDGGTDASFTALKYLFKE